MAQIKKFDLSGKEVGELSLSINIEELKCNPQLVKDYIVAIRANARQWSANTKTRPEVNHSGKKPHPQKGTGRARQGSLASPQYKGGGRIFGPRPKFDQHVRINKKEKRLAIRHLIAEKIENNQLVVLSNAQMNEPKTKTIVGMLDKIGIKGKRVLFISRSEAPDVLASPKFNTYDAIHLSLRNVPKASMSLFSNMNGYDLAITQNLVILEDALDELKAYLGG